GIGFSMWKNPVRSAVYNKNIIRNEFVLPAKHLIYRPNQQFTGSIFHKRFYQIFLGFGAGVKKPMRSRVKILEHKARHQFMQLQLIYSFQKKGQAIAGYNAGNEKGLLRLQKFV